MQQNLHTHNFAPSNIARPKVFKSNPESLLNVSLLRVARFSLVALVFLLPLFFLVGLWASVGFQKVLLALGVLTLAVSTLGILALHQNQIKTVLPWSAAAFVVFFVVSIISATFSSSPSDAFRGSLVEIDTVVSTLIVLGLMLLPLSLQGSKKSAMNFVQGFFLSSLILLSYVVLRFFVGPVLSFGSFDTVTSSPLGGFNDLAIFAGLIVLASILTLLFLPLRVGLQSILALAIMLSLVVLSVVNFLFVWIVVGLFSLIVAAYVILRDHLFVSKDFAKEISGPNWILTTAVSVVCLVSALFVFFNDGAGQQISQMVDINFLEVQPSFGETVNVARGVYQDNFLFGTGPNQFISAWREFKNPAISNTFYWNTDFSSGSSYLSTLAVTNGALGLISFLAFQVLYFWYGTKLLLLTKKTDSFWYFLASLSFLLATFLWILMYLYVPGHSVLFLAALFTGLTFAAGGSLDPAQQKTLPLVTTRQRGFALMICVVIAISCVVGYFLTIVNQYSAHASFNKIQSSTTDIVVVDQAAAAAYSKYPDDAFLAARAQVAVIEMNQLLTPPVSTEDFQERFRSASERGIFFSNAAILNAPEVPGHYLTLAAIFNNLAIAEVEGASGRAISSLRAAADLDPHKPLYSLIEAQMQAGRGNLGAARTAIMEALDKKSNYTEALHLLAQIDVAEGNTESAIETTLAILALEPNNPTRYYQLGILFTAVERVEDAMIAYNNALRLDPQHSNARYFRALLLIELDEVTAAIKELKIVQENNRDNELLKEIISQLEAGTIPSVTGADDLEVPVDERSPQQVDEVVTSDLAPETDLITPLNASPEEALTDEVIEASGRQ